MDTQAVVDACSNGHIAGNFITQQNLMKISIMRKPFLGLMHHNSLMSLSICFPRFISVECHFFGINIWLL